MRNALTVNVQITRIELVDLMIACAGIENIAIDGGKKWEELQNKLKAQLDKFDKMMDEYDECQDNYFDDIKREKKWGCAQ